MAQSQTSPVATQSETIEATLKVSLGGYNGICLPGPSEGSTGLIWEPQEMPECVSLTATQWLDAYHAPRSHPGIPGVRVFIFKGESVTITPAKMSFLLRHPGTTEEYGKAVCTIIVTKP